MKLFQSSGKTSSTPASALHRPFVPVCSSRTRVCGIMTHCRFPFVPFSQPRSNGPASLVNYATDPAGLQPGCAAPRDPTRLSRLPEPAVLLEALTLNPISSNVLALSLARSPRGLIHVSRLIKGSIGFWRTALGQAPSPPLAPSIFVRSDPPYALRVGVLTRLGSFR